MGRERVPPRTAAPPVGRTQDAVARLLINTGQDRTAATRGIVANDTSDGLPASVRTQDLDRAQRAVREIRAGCVCLDDHIRIVSEMPHGGVKAGGFGKDMSVYSLEGVHGDQAPISDITGRARKGWHGTVVTGPPAAPD